jgi:hypothetical protein
MKQILIKETNTIDKMAGTKFSLLISKNICPNLIFNAKNITKIEIPLDLKVLAGGEDWSLVFNITPILAENGIALLSAEKTKDKVNAVFMNLTDTDISLEEGLPIVEVTLAQLVSFRQIKEMSKVGNGSAVAIFDADGIAKIQTVKEERRSEAQAKKTKKKKD